MKKNNNGNGINVKIARLEEKLTASEKALQVANESMQARLASMNEIREQLRWQSGTFITRTEFDAKLEGIEKGKKDHIALLLSLLGIVIAIVSVLLRK